MNLQGCWPIKQLHHNKNKPFKHPYPSNPTNTLESCLIRITTNYICQYTRIGKKNTAIIIMIMKNSLKFTYIHNLQTGVEFEIYIFTIYTFNPPKSGVL